MLIMLPQANFPEAFLKASRSSSCQDFRHRFRLVDPPPVHFSCAIFPAYSTASMKRLACCHLLFCIEVPQWGGCRSEECGNICTSNHSHVKVRPGPIDTSKTHVTPLIGGEKKTLTHLFSAIYRGCNSIYI